MLNAAYVNKDHVIFALLNNSSAGYILIITYDNGKKEAIQSWVHGNFWAVAELLGLSIESLTED